MKRVAILFLAGTLICGTASATESIKHEFLAVDEPRGQLHYVNEFEASKDWSVFIGQKNRDVALTKNGTCIVSMKSGGYREYALDGGKLIKEVKCGADIISIIRTDNGHTFLSNSHTVWELDEQDQVVKETRLEIGGVRLMRLDNQGNFAYSSGLTCAQFANSDGEGLERLNLVLLNAGVYHPYHINQLKNGGYIITLGYGRNLLVLDQNKQVIRTVGYQGIIGRKPQTGKWPDTGEDVEVDGVLLHYLATSVQLDNGNIMVTNWNGHGNKDSQKGAQVIEFDLAGKIVWQWHDPVRAGSLHGLAVIR